MRPIRIGWFLARDRQSETFVPFLQRTLARLIMFPDGKNLLDKWGEQVDTITPAVFTREKVIHENGSSFIWNCTRFDDDGYRLSVKLEQYIDNVTTNYAYNGNKVKHRYTFSIPLPMKFIPPGYSAQYDRAVVIATDARDCLFTEQHAIRYVSAEILTGYLYVYLDHFPDLDGKDFSDYPNIKGDFNVLVEGWFLKTLP